MVKIDYSDLPKLREEFKDKKIVFCSGVFDLTHIGHIIFFEDCKNLGDILVVSVGSDALVKKYKGETRPVLNEQTRMKTVDSFNSVDYTLLDEVVDETNFLKGIEVVFEGLHPDIYVINKDASNIEYRRSLCDKYNVSLVILERHCPEEFDEISTTKIINKIISLNGSLI
jgi:cytidyltransferase-like protein